jgi:glycosyltransferase involved in cell wall biosynthesis
MKRIWHRITPILARHGSVAIGRRLVVSQSTMLGQLKNNQATLYLDVSVLARHDAKTGIQRIVRAVLLALLENPPLKKIQLVYATPRYGYRCACWDSRDGCVVTSQKDESINPSKGDVFMALDLSAHLLPRHFFELMRYKAQGMKIVSLVYDLLPELNPEWFNPKTVLHYRRWLRVSAKLADVFVTISNEVKSDLQGWLSKHGVSFCQIPIVAIQFAVDIDKSHPTMGRPSDSESLIKRLNSSSTVLMVGTVEPRKGYEEALNAFECLWEREQDICLVIVGKPGWKTESLQQRIIDHPLNGKDLFWFADASDEWLGNLYQACNLVLIASKGEGLGLPVIEAMARGKKLLARNIPVFREIAGNQITYFEDDSSEPLASAITLALKTPLSHTFKGKISWDSAIAELIDLLRSLGNNDFNCPDQYRI